MDNYSKLNNGFESEMIKQSMEYACTCHANTNQKYDQYPYSYHLKMVYDFGCKYAYLLNKSELDIALSACWAHDIIEDTRQSYNDVLKVCGYEIAEVVFALTNEKGRTRAERANEKYYAEIRANEIATFVKLCDRLANTTYSASHNQRMIIVYFNELEHFTQMLYNARFKDMFDELSSFK